MGLLKERPSSSRGRSHSSLTYSRRSGRSHPLLPRSPVPRDLARQMDQSGPGRTRGRQPLYLVRRRSDQLARSAEPAPPAVTPKAEGALLFRRTGRELLARKRRSPGSPSLASPSPASNASWRAATACGQAHVHASPRPPGWLPVGLKPAFRLQSQPIDKRIWARKDALASNEGRP
jgi:hypothetical protein